MWCHLAKNWSEHNTPLHSKWHSIIFLNCIRQPYLSNAFLCCISQLHFSTTVFLMRQCRELVWPCHVSAQWHCDGSINPTVIIWHSVCTTTAACCNTLTLGHCTRIIWHCNTAPSLWHRQMDQYSDDTLNLSDLAREILSKGVYAIIQAFFKVWNRFAEEIFQIWESEVHQFWTQMVQILQHSWHDRRKWEGPFPD